MLSRKTQSEPSLEVPALWVQESTKLLTEIYRSKLKRSKKKFELFAFRYPDEFLFVTSIKGTEGKTIECVTFFVSLDLDQKNLVPKDYEEALNIMGLLLDTYFALESNDFEDFDYVIHWEEGEIDGREYHFKIGRDDVALDIEANKILGEFF